MRSAAFFIAMIIGEPLMAQYYGMWTDPDQAVVNPWEQNIEMMPPGEIFTFCRVRYQTRGRRWGWDTDYPESDINFSLRLSELTTVQVNTDPRGRVIHVILDLTDDRIFDYPFIYMVEVGNLYLDEVDAARLREYLLRGGFLMVDDFWGEREWYNWLEQIEKVFPDHETYPMVPVPRNHPVFNMVFPLDEVPQIPSINSWMGSGTSTEIWGARASAHGIFHPDGRMMAIILHNTDLGDGWEREGVDYEYFRKFSVARAYPFGINIVVYAMTH